MKRIIHISPALPPIVNGVGDFCKILAENLAKDGSVENTFLVNKQYSYSEKRVITFRSSTFSKVLREQDADVIVLHYVGYAYDKHGLPFYLVRELQQYKRRVNCKILVFFHELYATSKSALKLPFYTSGLQRYIVRKLCSVATNIFTNCQTYDEILSRISTTASKRICTGIFSNIPESLFNHHEKEKSSLIVFGSLNRRKAVYNNSMFKDILTNLHIRVLYDVGPGTLNYDFPGVTVQMTGALPPAELAVYLNKARFGVLHYKPELLGKSGIFSAYTAFGVIPLNLVDTGEPLTDGLIDGKNYFNWRNTSNPELLFDERSQQEVLKWYRNRNQNAVTNTIKSFL